MLGNTVMVKPSSVTPGSTMLLDELFIEAGFPAGVYQTALLSYAQLDRFIADPRVRGVTLTGSEDAGGRVGAQAGAKIKPVVLELGGSDAFVVLDSADPQAAAQTAVQARLAIGGQICVSPKRWIVTDKVRDEFSAAVSQLFAAQVVGDPFDPATTVGPLSTMAGVDLLQEIYQDAIDKGAKVLVEGGRMDGPGAYFKPAVLAGITPEMRAYTEESFGPLGLIFEARDLDDAVRIANDTRFGLGGSVFAQDPDELSRAAQAIDTGMVGLNSWLGAPTEIPFGGTKSSGVGRELGPTGMDQFANLKTYAKIRSNG
jgi:succinate-semialdehyde dehydrogenase/glutarate-semialdehyde dehydrogenase